MFFLFLFLFVYVLGFGEDFKLFDFEHGNNLFRSLSKYESSCAALDLFQVCNLLISKTKYKSKKNVYERIVFSISNFSFLIRRIWLFDGYFILFFCCPSLRFFCCEWIFVCIALVCLFALFQSICLFRSVFFFFVSFGMERFVNADGKLRTENEFEWYDDDDSSVFLCVCQFYCLTLVKRWIERGKKQPNTRTKNITFVILRLFGALTLTSIVV